MTDILERLDQFEESDELRRSDFTILSDAADEIEQLRNMVEAHHTQWLNAQQMMDARDKEIERLRTVLSWYADLYNYQVAGGGGSPSMVMLPPGATIVDYDNGQRARKALE